MNIVEAMCYGFQRKELLEFIKFWIKSDGFGQDREKDNPINRRKTKFTVALHISDDHQIEIIKGVVFPGERPRELKLGEVFIQEGFDSVVHDIEEWIEQMARKDPEEINRVRFAAIQSVFGVVGIGFFLKTTTITDWGLRVSVIRTNIPEHPDLYVCLADKPSCDNILSIVATNIGIPK